MTPVQEVQNCVWPFPAPPVPTGFWTWGDWRTYMLRYRPRDYTGGMADKTAWSEYQEGKRLQTYQDWAQELNLKTDEIIDDVDKQ